MAMKIWDAWNKQWLEVMAIYFGKDGSIWKIDACDIGSDPLSDGWYDLQGVDLDYIAIDENLRINTHLIP